MKICTTLCDICLQPIQPPETAFKLNPNHAVPVFKQVGCDMVLTGRRNRYYIPNTNLMVRINASFYIGAQSSITSMQKTPLDEIHFHHECIEKVVRDRLHPFFIPPPQV